MSFAKKIKKLLERNKPTQAQLEDLEKDQQAAARARGAEIIALLQEAMYLDDMKMPESIMEEEQFREMAGALSVALYEAPVLRLNVEKIDGYLKSVALAFKEALIEGDLDTAKLSVGALCKGITEIRVDVPDADANKREAIENSKNQTAERLAKVVELSRERNKTRNKIAKKQADLDKINQDLDILDAEILKIDADHPEYMIEIKNCDEDILSPEAAMLKSKLDAFNALNSEIDVIAGDGVLLRDAETKRTAEIDQIKSEIDLLETVITPDEAEDVRRLADEYVRHVDELYRTLDVIGQAIRVSYDKMKAVHAKGGKNAAGSAIEYQTTMEKRLEKKQKELARLKAGPQGGSTAGEILRVQAEIEEIKNSQNNKILISN